MRYLSGETSEQETQQIQEWLQANKDNRQVFARHKKLWLGSRLCTVYDTDMVNYARHKIDLRLRHSDLQRSLNNANKWIKVLAYAASILLIVGVLIALNNFQSHTPVKQENILAGSEVEVPYGSKSLMTLPDGSKVWVNAGSKISYPADFGITSRNVYLTGEAYFDVVKRENIPFYVNTDVIKIKVYGTAFNVKAYKDENMVETTLDRGAISIIRNDAPNQEINVEPKQKITILRETQKTKTSTTAPPSTIAAISSEPLKGLDVLEVKSTEAITAWKDNRLIFEQEPMWSLAKQLERRYNVRFRFGSEKIKTIRFTAIIKEMPIDQVLEAIALTSPINYRIKGSEITLTENKNYTYK